MLYRSKWGVLEFVSILILMLCLTPAVSIEANMTDVAIGIDLGTTYSSVGVLKEGKLEILKNEYGNKATPSYVAFTESGQILIGEDALNQATTNPKNTIYSIKRWIGHKFIDNEVSEAIENLPYKIVPNDTNPYIEVTINGVNKYYAPEEISAKILSKMKKIAEDYLGKQVKRAVVTIPATFNANQRQATKDACKISGFEDVKLLNEPTAAAIAYGFDVKKEKSKNILVFDLGGGTFDVSMLKVTNEGLFEVIASDGDPNLGGDDFDQKIINYLISKFKEKYNEDPRDNKFAIQKLKHAAEEGKRELSDAESAKIEIKDFHNGKNLIEELTRVEFEKINMDLFKKTFPAVERLLDDVMMKKTDIDILTLVGGSSRIPKVQELVRDYFGIEPSMNLDPEIAVAQGAAIFAGMHFNKEIETTKRIKVKDLTPLNLGVEIVGGIMSDVVKKNTLIPTQQSEEYTTVEDNQTNIKVQIFQGNNKFTSHNTKLAEFMLYDIPQKPKGIPKIIVTFIIDEDGILNVSAVILDTGKRNNTMIQNWRLSANEIARMANEEKELSQKDKEDRAKAERERENSSSNKKKDL